MKHIGRQERTSSLAEGSPIRAGIFALMDAALLGAEASRLVAIGLLETSVAPWDRALRVSIGVGNIVAGRLRARHSCLFSHAPPCIAPSFSCEARPPLRHAGHGRFPYVGLLAACLVESSGASPPASGIATPRLHGAAASGD